jgi:hypothetical protein
MHAAVLFVAVFIGGRNQGVLVGARQNFAAKRTLHRKSHELFKHTARKKRNRPARAGRFLSSPYEGSYLVAALTGAAGALTWPLLT